MTLLIKKISRLFVYYNARLIENTVEKDSGVVYLRNALKGLKLYGVCSEDLWPYVLENFDDRPSEAAYTDAINRRIKDYEKLDSITDILEALNLNYPVTIGLEIFDNFINLTGENNTVTVPEGKQVPIRSHAVIILGYSLAEQQFLIKNSFGNQWGQNGYAWMPFDYAKTFVFEKWIFNLEDQ